MVLSIASRVSNGAVGNSLVEAAFLRLAPEQTLLTIDTVNWTAPGNHPRRTGIELPGDELARQLAVLTDARDRLGGGASLVVAGYLRTSDQVGALAAFLAGPGRSRVDLVLDPVLGDQGRLYIPQSTAEAIRDRLVPHARVLLPNVTEAAWLVTGDPKAGETDFAALEPRLKRYAESHGVVLVVKSIPLPDDRIGVRLYRPADRTIAFEHPRVPIEYMGTGDLFAGVVATGLARNEPVETAVRRATEFVPQVLMREMRAAIGLRAQIHAVELS